MVKIPYTPIESGTDALPLLSLQITTASDTLNVMGLLASGSVANILPNNLAELLGAVWDTATPIALPSPYATLEARTVTFDIIVPSISEAHITQAFAWVRSDDVPLALGQTFFKAFNISFNGLQSYFEISPAS